MVVFFRKLIEDIIFNHYNDEITINTKTHFHTNEKLFELFCIENDFAKYFPTFRNLSMILFRTL